MAFTYDVTQGYDLTTPVGRRNYVRFRTGDTVEDRALLQDEEIDASLALADDRPNQGAIYALESMIAKASGEVDYKTGKLTVFARQRVASLRLLLEQIKQSSLGSAPCPLGAPEGPPVFSLGMDDNPGASYRPLED